MPGNKPLKIFISYAHEDRTLMLKLVSHFSTLVRRREIEVWQDGEITGGQERDAEIKEKLDVADIAILLVSSDFTNSEYICDVEVPRIYKREKLDTKFRIIPILMRPCDYEDNIAKKGMWPKNHLNDIVPAVSKTWDTVDEPYHNVVEELKRVIIELKVIAQQQDIIVWKNLIDSFKNGTKITGTVIRKTPGRIIVDYGGLDTFLPDSQIDIRPIIHYDQYINRVMEFKVIMIKESIKSAVVSRKALLENELEEKRAQILSSLEKGQVL